MIDAATQNRYRILLDFSLSIAQQPSLQAVLHSVRELLSKVIAFDSASLLLLDPNRPFVRVVAIDRFTQTADPTEIGLQITLAGTVLGRAIDQQKPIFIDDPEQELQKFPELRSRESLVTLRTACVFPLTTQRRKLGALVFGSTEKIGFAEEDIELMASVASHVAVALESALAIETAGIYQNQLAHERDRLKLLLEINNHVVSKLEINELFLSASTSLRKYFVNDFTGFWMMERGSHTLECAVMDFPNSRGFLGDLPVSELQDQELDKMRARTNEILSPDKFDQLPSVFRGALQAESIKTIAVSPLTTANRPLGVLTMGSRRPDAFRQADLDLLSQISNQIALGLENAVSFDRLNASKERLEEERLYLESEIRSEYNFEEIVGKSSALRKVLQQISIVAPTTSTVLLHGETGTGKELIARAIHMHSTRKDRTFVRLNCAAIPSGLVESELFGHERGAFTGALIQKRGRFELADHGTLFLDEIGDISLDLQPKLLRALQEREFERLGSTKTIGVDVRLVTATHRDLQSMIRNGQFREDLFYRLNVFPIEIPPLRERREDIPLLVHFFVSRLARRMQKHIRVIPKEAMNALASAPWPGNIRELENFVERAVILSQGEELNVPLAELEKNSIRGTTSGLSFQQAERQAILDALKASSGRISGFGGAAERLGLKRTTLQNKMRRLNITRADY
jgi:formate hydrogenlyase transcriptional activator